MPPLIVNDVRGRTPAELRDAGAAPATTGAVLPSEWVLHAPAFHATAAVQDAASAAFGSTPTLQEVSAGHRRQFVLTDVSHARWNAHVGTTGPAGMALVACRVTVDPGTGDDVFTPLDGGTASAGGPALALNTSGHRLGGRVALSTAARSTAGVLCTVCVRGGDGSAVPTIGAAVVDWLVGGASYCDALPGMEWCVDFGAYADQGELDTALADPALFDYADGSVTWTDGAALLGNADGTANGVLAGSTWHCAGADRLWVRGSVALLFAGAWEGDHTGLPENDIANKNERWLRTLVPQAAGGYTRPAVTVKKTGSQWKLGIYDEIYDAAVWFDIADPTGAPQDVVLMVEPSATVGVDGPWRLQFRLWSGPVGGTLTEHTGGTAQFTGPMSGVYSDWPPALQDKWQLYVASYLAVDTGTPVQLRVEGAKLVNGSDNADPWGLL